MPEASHQPKPCVCLDKDGHWITDHEDELIVGDVIEDVKKRCLACGRRFTTRFVPGDYTLGGRADKPASGGARGKSHLIATPDLQLDEIWDHKVQFDTLNAYWTQTGTVQDVNRFIAVLSSNDPAFGLLDVHVRQKVPIGERIEIEFCSLLESDRVRALLANEFGDQSVVSESLVGIAGVSFRSGAPNG